MDRFHVVDANDCSYLVGPMRAVEVYVNSVTFAGPKGSRYCVPTDGFGPFELAELIRYDWRPQWYPPPKPQFPQKGILIFTRE